MEFLVVWLKIFQLRALTSLNWPEYHCDEIVSQIFLQLRLDNNNLLQCRLKYLKIERSVEAPSGVEELTRIEAKKVRHPLWLPRPSTCKCWHWHFPIQLWQQLLDKLEPPSKLVAKLNNGYFVQLSPSIPGLMFSEVVKACPKCCNFCSDNSYLRYDRLVQIQQTPDTSGKPFLHDQGN